MVNNQKQEVKSNSQAGVETETKKNLIETLGKSVSEKITEKFTSKAANDTKTKISEDKAVQTEHKTVPEGAQTEKLYSVKELTSNLTPKKVIKLVALLVLLVLIAMAVYVRFVRKTPINETPYLINAPTPSFFPYEKYKPSIYAEDANFKKIDEGVSVLDNEVKSVQLEEKPLLPPSLDFDIKFD